jgi:hypothetical protein
MSADNRREDDDSVEIQPIERRMTPRGLVAGMTVEVLEPGPLQGRTFLVGDLALESFFLDGEAATACEPGKSYQVRLVFGETSADCVARCVRCERAARVGAVLKLLSDENEARKLIAAVLQPTQVPPGAD